MNGPVVVGVDGSASSLVAVETAALEAERRGTGLWLVHALAWPSAHVPPGVLPWDPDGSALRTIVNGSLTEAERRARRVAPRVTIRREVLMGEPVTVLESESRTASLTVVEGRPASGLAGRLRESGALRLAARGRCPVLVVRGRPERTGPVVLADDTSQGAAEFAFAEAAERGADLVVLHPRAGIVRQALTRLRKKHPSVTVRDRHLRGRAGRALVEASDGAQLVVIAAHHNAAEMLPGSARRTLIGHARCPVAVVPAAKG